MFFTKLFWAIAGVVILWIIIEILAYIGKRSLEGEDNDRNDP